MTIPDKPLGKTQREHHYYMLDALRRFEWDMHNEIEVQRRIPPLWHDIASRRERKKMKVGFTVDEDVVKWFKSMGPGYQPRMNDVLRAFMHMKLTGLLKGVETIEPFREGVPVGTERPNWGSTEKLRRG